MVDIGIIIRPCNREKGETRATNSSKRISEYSSDVAESPILAARQSLSVKAWETNRQHAFHNLLASTQPCSSIQCIGHAQQSVDL